MRAAFPEPVLTITPAAVRDLQGRDALSGLWTLFTKCKESLQDGRRLENISWRLWYREIMRDGASPSLSASSSPSISRTGSSEKLCEQKAEKKVKEMDSGKGSEKNVDGSHLVSPQSAATFALFASAHQQHRPISTPHSPPPAYALGFDFIPNDRDELGSPALGSADTSRRKNHSHPLTPSASQTSVDTDPEAGQINQEMIVPSPGPPLIPRAPSILQPSRELNPSSSASVELSIPITLSQSRPTEKRPTIPSHSSTSTVLSVASTASASVSSNSKPRHPSHRRRRSSFVDGAEEEPVNVGLIICEMLPSAGLESTDKTPMYIPFPSPSLSQSSRAPSPASAVASSNLQNTPTLAVHISDIDQQLDGSSSSTPTTAATVVGVGLAFADFAKSAASTLPTPEIEVAEEDALPAPPRVGGARYPLIVPSPQTSPPRPHVQQQHQSQSGSVPRVIPPIVAPGGVQPPQLVIVTPTPGATPHPTPPATPLVGWGMGSRLYGQYLIVPRSRGQGHSKTRGGDGEREDDDDDEGSTEGDEDEDGSEDYTDSEDGDYEDVDEEEQDQEEHVATKAAPIPDTAVSATLSNASPPPSHTGLIYSAMVGGDSQKRVSISSAISDQSTTSNASSNTTHTTSSAETRDTDASLQPNESKRDKGKQKELTLPDDEWQEQYEDDDEEEYNSPSHEDLDDEDAIMEELEAEYERGLQRGNPDAIAHEPEPAATESDGPSSMATMIADVEKPSSALSSTSQQDQDRESLEQEQPQVEPLKPLSMHTKRRSPVITARSSKGLRGGFTAGKGKSMSRSRSRNRDEVLKLTSALMMNASAAVATSPPQQTELGGGPVSVANIPIVDATPAPVVVSQPVRAPPALLPVVSAAVVPLSAQLAVSPPPPSPTYSMQSTLSSGRGRSRNIVAIGRGVGGNGGKGKRRGGHLVALKRRLSSDGRKGGSSPNDDNREGEEEEGGAVSVSDMRDDENETSIEMDAHDILDEGVNPQAKVEQSDSPAMIQQPSPDVDNQAIVRPIDPAQVQAHIETQIQAEKSLHAEQPSTTEHRAPVRFNIGSNSEDGTGSASASGSASVGRSGSTGFRSGSGSGSRTRGGMLKKRLEKARARAVSRSVEEEKETGDERGGDTDTHRTAAVQQAQLQAAQAQSASRAVDGQKPMQPTVRPLLQPMGNRKGDRQLEELLKMEQRTHQLASRQVSMVAVGGALPPVIAPLAPSPRPNARSPSQGRGKSPRTKSVIAQRASASRSSGSTSKNFQDPQLMKVLNHVMDLPSNGNRQKKVVLATSESEDDEDDGDYETETDVDGTGLVAALSPRQQRAFADHMAAAQAAPEVVQDQQQNDDDGWSSATDDINDDASPPSQARPHASHSRQHVPQQPPVRPPAVQRTYSSHYPAGRTGRVVKQQLVEQQRQQQLLLQQQQQQQNQRRGKQQRDTIEINRLPSESFQNLALAKLRNDSVGGLTRLLNPGLNEQELLSTARRGYSSGDILRDFPTPIRRVPTGGMIGGLHGLRPLTSANPSLARMPLMQPPFAPMAVPPPNWNPVADPRIQMNVPHPEQNYTTGRPPLVRRHTENAPGPAANVLQPVEASTPAQNVVPTPVAAPGPMVLDVPNATVVSPVAAPAMSKSHSVVALGPQPHRRQLSSSSTATALRPNSLLTKLTLNKSFIAPASTTITVNRLASDRASPAGFNPKSSNSLYSKVAPDATSRIRALNALVNSRKPMPVAKSPPTASPIAASSSAPADAAASAAAPQKSSLSPSPAPPATATVHESITAPNGANVAVGLNGYGGAGRYQKKGPPADVELETEDEDEDGMYEDESSDHSDSVAEGTFQTERQKQIAASLACSLSADPVLDDPPPKPPVNPKGKGVPKGTQAQVQRSAQGKIASGGRRGGKSAERVRAVRDSGANAGGPAVPEVAQVLPTVGAAASGEGSQQRRPPKTLQFTEMLPSERALTRQASRQALQPGQNEQHPAQYMHDRVQGHPQQQPPSGPQQQPFHQQQEYLQLQQQQQLQLQRQLQQLEQQQIQQQQLLQQQQLQYRQQQQYLLNAQQQQQQFMYQPPGQGQFGYPHQHQQHPQHPPHLYQQGGPSNHPNYTPIPYTQSQQHFPTASLQKLGFPYNLPVTAIPSTPRTTRRTMVKDELSESVRQGVVIGRKITRLNTGRRTSMGEDAEWRRPLTAAPSMVQLLPKGTLKTMGVEDDELGASKRKGTVAEPDPAMRRALQHSRNKSWADTTHTSGW